MFLRRPIPFRLRMLDALIGATSLLVLCAVIVSIDNHAGEQLARVVIKSASANGGLAVQLHDGARTLARSAWDITHVYGPLVSFAGIAALLVLFMIRTK